MFEKYASYGFDDFVRDKDFIDWVRSPNEEQNRFWDNFLKECPFQQTVVLQAKRAVVQLKEASRQEVGEDDAREIWEAVQVSLAAPPERRFLFSGRWRSYMIGAAAVVLMLVSIAVAWWGADGAVPGIKGFRPDAGDELFTAATGADMTEISNTAESTMLVRLPDSSGVTLHRGGRLRFSKHFDGALREVYLVGEAFFEVTRNPEKPFVVYTNDLVTKVLGTSFYVRADAGSQDVTVTVKTGKVSVFANRKSMEDPETGGVILRANQQVAYTRGVEKLTRTLVADPVPVLAPEELQQFVFTNAPIGEIFKALEKAYGTEILFDEEMLTGCRLTSTLDSEESLFEKLDALCEAVEASYKVVDAQIVITGKKCPL